MRLGTPGGSFTTFGARSPYSFCPRSHAAGGSLTWLSAEISLNSGIGFPVCLCGSNESRLSDKRYGTRSGVVKLDPRERLSRKILLTWATPRWLFSGTSERTTEESYMPPRSTMWRTLCRFVGLFAIGFALVSGPVGIGASAGRQQVFEGAKKEGRLVLYTGMDIEEANQYTKEFTKKHPFIKTEVFRSSGEKVQARFLVEHRADVHNADIFQTSIVQVYQLKNAGLLAKYISE